MPSAKSATEKTKGDPKAEACATLAPAKEYTPPQTMSEAPKPGKTTLRFAPTTGLGAASAPSSKDAGVSNTCTKPVFTKFWSPTPWDTRIS